EPAAIETDLLQVLLDPFKVGAVEQVAALDEEDVDPAAAFLTDLPTDFHDIVIGWLQRVTAGGCQQCRGQDLPGPGSSRGCAHASSLREMPTVVPRSQAASS